LPCRRVHGEPVHGTLVQSVGFGIRQEQRPLLAQELLLEESGSGPSKNLYNEKYFLKSRSLVESAIKELDFGVSYFRQTDTILVELYRRSPIECCPTRIRSSCRTTRASGARS
jgi:hypothetical protein